MILKQCGVECPENGLSDGDIHVLTSCKDVKVVTIGSGDVLSLVNLMRSEYVCIYVLFLTRECIALSVTSCMCN